MSLANFRAFSIACSSSVWRFANPSENYNQHWGNGTLVGQERGCFLKTRDCGCTVQCGARICNETRGKFPEVTYPETKNTHDASTRLEDYYDDATATHTHLATAGMRADGELARRHAVQESSVSCMHAFFLGASSASARSAASGECAGYPPPRPACGHGRGAGSR